MSLTDFPLWYFSRSKVQYRAANSHFTRYRYPETIFCIQDCIELGLKAILQFHDQRYPEDHDVFARDIRQILTALSEKNPDFKREFSRTILISDRWAGAARNLSRYGEQTLRVPGDQIFTRNDAQQGLQDGKEIINLLHKIKKKIIFNPVYNMGILNGYFEERTGEVPCTNANYSSYNVSDWSSYFNIIRIETV